MVTSGSFAPLRSSCVPPSTGPVHRLGGEAAGVQQVHPAALQAEPGGGRLVRPLQGAAGHGPLPRPQVTGGRAEANGPESTFLMQRTRRSPRDRKYPSAGAGVTKERDSAPLCLGANPTAWLEQVMFFAFAFL